MEHSLAGSVIDGWFIGGAPSFPPFEIGMPAQSSLTSVLARARKAASDPNFVAIGLVSGAGGAIRSMFVVNHHDRSTLPIPRDPINHTTMKVFDDTTFYLPSHWQVETWQWI